MAVYRGIFGSTAHYMRADTLRQGAAYLTRAFDAQPQLVEEVGADYEVSVGSGRAYDDACNSMGHKVPKLVTRAASEEQLNDVLAFIGAV